MRIRGAPSGAGGAQHGAGSAQNDVCAARAGRGGATFSSAPLAGAPFTEVDIGQSGGPPTQVLSAEALLDKLEGPWLPRWVPAPRRAEVDAATDRLRSLEAQILHGRNAARKALTHWAREGVDERPMVQKLTKAVAVWTQLSLGAAWRQWKDTALYAARVARHAARLLLGGRGKLLREALTVWRLLRLGFVRRRLAASVVVRLGRQTALAFAHWATSLRLEKRAYEEQLLLATVFRRWLLLRQTAMLSRLMIRDQLAAIDAEVGGPLHDVYHGARYHGGGGAPNAPAHIRSATTDKHGIAASASSRRARFAQ